MYGRGRKYHYREVEKKTFKDAKEVAQHFLEECLKEVIQHFINQSWRFMTHECLLQGSDGCCCCNAGLCASKSSTRQSIGWS